MFVVVPVSGCTNDLLQTVHQTTWSSIRSKYIQTLLCGGGMLVCYRYRRVCLLVIVSYVHAWQ